MFAPKPTKIFDTYWRWAAERQNIFLRRLAGQAAPWTDDPIFQRYKFTNAYRASDRVSRYLIRNVIYQGNQEPTQVVFRILLFKLFNRVSTWELLKQEFGEISRDGFSPERYGLVLNRALARKQKIYSAAYIMPAYGHQPGQRKHLGHLHLLNRMMKDGLGNKIKAAKSLASVYELIRAYPMMGDFLAYQYTIDINYSNVINFSENDFVVPGPGARRGIKKCFSGVKRGQEVEIIRWVTEHQREEFAKRGLVFKNLWGRDLHLIDCQGLFCEVDKYTRVSEPSGDDPQARIKQIYRPSEKPPTPWYPPKWGINENISRDTGL